MGNPLDKSICGLCEKSRTEQRGGKVRPRCADVNDKATACFDFELRKGVKECGHK